jgi:hypothetical protein
MAPLLIFMDEERFYSTRVADFFRKVRKAIKRRTKTAIFILQANSPEQNQSKFQKKPLTRGLKLRLMYYLHIDLDIPVRHPTMPQ